jgi:hypothetical protein
MADRAWQPIGIAPFDRDLQLSVFEDGELYSLVFACRRTATAWVASATNNVVVVRPTQWREWSPELPRQESGRR